MRQYLVARHMEKHKCGLETVCFKHPFKFVGFIDAAFMAQPDEPTGLALGVVATTMQEDSPKNEQPHNVGGLADLVEFIVRRQRRVVRSTFGAELNGLVDSVEQLLLLQITPCIRYIAVHTERRRK